jgi:multidrug transporter EmrE-like cation transporter
MSYVFVSCTVLLTVYGQLVIKWRVGKAGAFPTDAGDKILFLLQLLLSPWVISALAAALLASVTWMAAMTKLQLSHAYPLTSAAFILVMLFSSLLFDEPLTVAKIVGATLIIAGIAVGSQG